MTELYSNIFNALSPSGVMNIHETLVDEEKSFPFIKKILQDCGFAEIQISHTHDIGSLCTALPKIPGRAFISAVRPE